MDIRERHRAEQRYEEWKGFFVVTQNVAHLEESNKALADIHVLTRYITYLRDKDKPDKFTPFLFGVFVGAAIMLVTLLISGVAHQIPSCIP